MQDFFFVGLVCAIALGTFLIKSILFIIHMRNLKKSNEIISGNQEKVKTANKVQQLQQHSTGNHNQHLTTQNDLNSFETVANWKIHVDDPRLLSDDLRQQFLTKTKTRRTPTSLDRASPRERVPLATTDFGESPDEEDFEDPVPIYTYNPIIRGTQV